TRARRSHVGGRRRAAGGWQLWHVGGDGALPQSGCQRGRGGGNRTRRRRRTEDPRGGFSPRFSKHSRDRRAPRDPDHRARRAWYGRRPHAPQRRRSGHRRDELARFSYPRRARERARGGGVRESRLGRDPSRGVSQSARLGPQRRPYGHGRLHARHGLQPPLSPAHQRRLAPDVAGWERDPSHRTSRDHVSAALRGVARRDGAIVSKKSMSSASPSRKTDAAAEQPARRSEATGGIVTLLSDFGQRDGFAGIVKGIVLGICPGAIIV